MPSGMSSILNSAKTAAEAPPALGAWKPPRMSRPGAEVFRAADARKAQLKGLRPKRQISVKTFRQFDSLKNSAHGKGLFGGELVQLLQGVAMMFSGMGSMGKTPVSKMKGHMNGFRDGATMLAYKVSDLPNEMFGAMRSKRQATAPEAPASDNEVKVTLAELAVAQQKNWFTYLRSYNGSAIECQELEFCRTAQGSNGLRTPTARSGSKFLRWVEGGSSQSVTDPVSKSVS